MSDPIVKSVLGGITWGQNTLIDKTEALSEVEFCQQPSAKAPPIGWHLFHIARISDMLQASLPNRKEHWKQTGLVAKFDLDLTKLGLLQMGATQSPQEATDTIAAIEQAPLITYARTVFDMTDAALEALTMDDLYAPRESILRIDWSANPLTEGKGAEVLLFDDLDFHSGHTQRHLGMVEALIGSMLNREGTATV